MKPEWMHSAALFVPWIKLAGDRRMRIDAADIVKTVVTSAVISGVVMYGTQRVLESELANLKNEVTSTRLRVDEIALEQARRKPMADYVENRMRSNGK